MKAHPGDPVEAELDLAIPNMEKLREELRVQALLQSVPGVIFVRLVSRGALVRYRAGATNAEAISDALEQAGFRASVYQESVTGVNGAPSTAPS